MKKMLLMVIASGALIALVPATALAKGHHHRSHRHARAHHRIFINGQGSPSSQGMAGTAPSPRGTVVSFTNGVLTIKANDGNTASGRVTSATELKCEAPSSASFRSHDRGRDGSGRDEDRGDNNNGDHDNGDNDNGDNDGDRANQMCSASNLIPGATVREAELRISSAGSVWSEVELVTQPSTTPGA